MSINTKTEKPPVPEPSAPAGATAPKIHLGYLDSLRALAAISVVVTHALQGDPSEDGLVGPWQWFRYLFFHGHHAVCAFIVLSGFCLMLPIVRGDGFLRGGAFRFFKKRALRILPPYYCAVLICLLVIWLGLNRQTGTGWDHAVLVTLKGLIIHLLLVQDAFITGQKLDYGLQIDYPLWSVSVEWRIYFAFPVLVFLWGKVGPFATTLVAIITGYVLLVLLRPTFIWTYTNGVSPEFLGLFALGMLGAGITYSQDGKLKTLRERVPWALVAAAATAIMLLFTNLKIYNGRVIEISILDTIVGFWAMTALVYAGWSNKTLLHRILSWRPLAFLGTFAYSIYLIHAPILQFFWQYVIHPLHLSGVTALLTQLLVVVPLTVSGAYLFFLVCEKPFLARPVVLNTQ